MEQPLWKILSGEFAGWQIEDNLYDINGNNVGYFDGDIAYSLLGEYLGEMYNADGWIGKREGLRRANKGAKNAGGGTSKGAYADRAGMAAAGWVDPEF